MDSGQVWRAVERLDPPTHAVAPLPPPIRGAATVVNMVGTAVAAVATEASESAIVVSSLGFRYSKNRSKLGLITGKDSSRHRSSYLDCRV